MKEGTYAIKSFLECGCLTCTDTSLIIIRCKDHTAKLSEDKYL